MCVCVVLYVCRRGTLIRSTSTANRDGEHKPVGLRKWQRMRERERVHSSTAFPPLCVCVHSCQCFSHTQLRVSTVCVWVCVCHMNTAQWLVCEVTDSFIMASAHRETAPSRGGREEDRDTRWARFTFRPDPISPVVGGGEGGQLLSPLMNHQTCKLKVSSTFNLQVCPEPLRCIPFTPNPKIHTLLFQTVLLLSSDSPSAVCNS